ncbi:hypothetical protein C8R48DRAFT_728481, partial [Suillus tomentosus]
TRPGGVFISFVSFVRLFLYVISSEAVVRIYLVVVLHFSRCFGWGGYAFYLHTVIIFFLRFCVTYYVVIVL